MIIPQGLGYTAPTAAPDYSKYTLAPSAMTPMRVDPGDYLDPNKAYVRVGPFIFEATPTQSLWGWHNVYTNPAHFNGQDMSWLANILKSSYDADSNDQTLATQPNRGTFWNAGGLTPVNPPGVPAIGANSRIPAQQWPQQYLDEYRAWMTALGIGSSDYYLPYLSIMHGVGLVNANDFSYDPDKGPLWTDNACYGDMNRWRQIWYGLPIGQLLNPADNQQYVLSIGLGSTDGTSWDAQRRCWYNSCTKTCDTATRHMALYAWWVKVVPANKDWWDSIKSGLVSLLKDACWLVNQQWFQYGVDVAVTAESGATATAATNEGIALAKQACAAAFASSTTPPPVPTVTATPPPTPGSPGAAAKPLRYPTACIKRHNLTHNAWTVYCPPGVGPLPTSIDTSKLKISAATMQRIQTMGPIRAGLGAYQLAPSATQQQMVSTAAPAEPRGLPSGLMPGSGTASTPPTCAADERFDVTQNACVPLDTSVALVPITCGAGLMIDPTTNTCVMIPTTPIYKKPIVWAIAGGVALVGGFLFFRSRTTKAVSGRLRR